MISRVVVGAVALGTVALAAATRKRPPIVVGVRKSPTKPGDVRPIAGVLKRK